PDAGLAEAQITAEAILAAGQALQRGIAGDEEAELVTPGRALCAGRGVSAAGCAGERRQHPAARSMTCFVFHPFTCSSNRTGKTAPRRTPRCSCTTPSPRPPNLAPRPRPPPDPRARPPPPSSP